MICFFVFYCLLANSLQSPYKKLKEALSSMESFEKHYLVRTGLCVEIRVMLANYMQILIHSKS